MKSKCFSFIIIVAICSLALPVGASTLFLDDWGVTPNSLTPTSAPSNTVDVQEPYTGADVNGVVDPGWGGYKFDILAGYIGFEGTKAHIAVITGLPQAGAPDYWRYNNIHYPYNASTGYPAYDWNQSLEKYWYDPGSIVLDIGDDGSNDFAVTTRIDRGDGYSDGATYAPTPGAGTLVSGNLQFENSRSWDNVNDYTEYTEADPWAAVGFVNEMDLGADFSYSYFGDVTTGAGTFATYAIEAIIDTSVLGLDPGDTLAIHWTMECGNDYIDMSSDVPVPEPGTMILLGSGIVGFIALRKKYNI